MKEKVKKNKFILIVLLASVFLVLPLFRQGYFTHHDDLHFIRIYEMRRCFADTQIPCRWNPDMAFGFGQPMFNYYSVFPYYLGALVSYVFGYMVSVKMLFFLPLVLGGVFMYIFSRKLMGKYESLVASILYLFAPYRALDTYVRGAVAESIAIALLPLLFYFSLRLVKKYTLGAFIGLIFTLSIFLLTHNVSVLIATPVYLVWLMLILYLHKFKNTKYVFLSGVFSFLMASFFLLPAYFEKGLITSSSLISEGLNFRAHFVSLRQTFIDRSWGYGTSVIGTDDTMSFQIGWPHVFLVALSVLFVAIFIFVRKNISRKVFCKDITKNDIFYYIFFLVLFLGSAYMAHARSAFIWERLSIIWFVQFPWRFLLLTIFAGSILGGYVIKIVNNQYKPYLAYLVVIIAVVLNVGYFKPWKYVDVSEQDKLAGEMFEEQQKGAVLDYLPLSADEPMEIAPDLPYFSEGAGFVESYVGKSNRFGINLTSSKESMLIVPVFDFSGWEVYVDDKKIEHKVSDTGLIAISLNKGKHTVTGYFVNTNIRKIANMLTIIGMMGFVVFIFYEKNKKHT